MVGAVLCFIPACNGNIPDAEIGQAEAAISAALTAGADVYTRDELSAARSALQNARLAIDARDYRLALNDALEARDSATAAAKTAAERKADARAGAERALRDANLALTSARSALKTAETARRPARATSRARQAIADTEHRVQEARTAFASGDYPNVLRVLKEPTALLRDSQDALDTAAAAKSKQRRR